MEIYVLLVFFFVIFNLDFCFLIYVQCIFIFHPENI